MMIRARYHVLPLAIAFAAGCAGQDSTTSPVTVPLFQLGEPGAGPVGDLQNFVAPQSGREEVQPVDTRATGLARFQLSKDGSEIGFKLIASNIHNVTQAHIHCGLFGTNGLIVVWLYPAPPAPSEIVLIPGRSQGVLSEGTITPDDVIARPSSDACPGGLANFEELLAKLRTGGAYVNVHTQQNAAGEIRGQVRALGPHQ